MANMKKTETKKMAGIKTEAKTQISAPHAAGAVAAPWQSFRTELDRLFEQFNQPLLWPGFGLALPAEGVKLPTVDMVEDEKAFTLSAELPGLEAKDVEVTLDGRTLVIKGEKHQDKTTRDKNYHLTERSYGAFERNFYLPEGVDAGAISANVDKGVLTVILPKLAKPPAGTRKIEVKPSVGF
ncbi:Hsp20/alpha crystallin family protein [Acidocella sp.]|uniref:Hsp20/alpha crystallin family protein n=2 Tax=Acidocella sp. TaxID=50710 RepID=UPI0026283F43|nr:Hsp20/alpha crystallin family protein [Acidocella sp.]